MPNPKRCCCECGLTESSKAKLQVCLDDDIRCNQCKSKRWPGKNISPLKGKINDGQKVQSELNSKDFQSLADSLEFISVQVSQLNSKVDGTNKKMNDLLQEITSLKSEIKQKDAIIADLTDRVDVLEQKDKAKNLMVKGVKLQSFSMAANGANAADDDISSTNKEVMKSNFVKFAKDTLGVEVAKSDIVEIYPVSKKGHPSSDNTRIVFSSMEKKDIVYSQRKVLFQQKKGIYINEDLTSKNFELLMEARRMKREQKYEYVWTKKGVVHCKSFADAMIPAKTLTIKRKSDLK